MDWTLIIANLGGQVALMGAVVWLARTLITHNLRKGTEEFKHRLRAEHERAVDELRHRMEITRKEHEIVFSELHVKRAAVIDEIYQKIIETLDAAEACIDALKADQDKRRFDLAKIAIEKGDDLAELVVRKRLYFSESLASELEELYISLIDAGVYYREHCLRLQKGGEDRKFHPPDGRGRSRHEGRSYLDRKRVQKDSRSRK